MRTFTLPVVLLLVLLQCGCSSVRVPREEMEANARAFHLQIAEISLGKHFTPTNLGFVAHRVSSLNWDASATVADLVHRWNRATYTHLDATFEIETGTSGLSGRIYRLPAATQKTLREIWVGRLRLALQDSTFRCDTDAVVDALRGEGLIIYYFLVGRHNSAEMGHVDVVKVVATNTNGQIVAITKPQYSLAYPLLFCEEKEWLYNFLF